MGTHNMALREIHLLAAIIATVWAMPEGTGGAGHGTVFLKFANGAKKPVLMAPSTRFKGQAIGHVHLDDSEQIGEDVQWSSNMKMRFVKGAVSNEEGGARQLTLMGKLEKHDHLGENAGAGTTCSSSSDCATGYSCAVTYGSSTSCASSSASGTCQAATGSSRITLLSTTITTCGNQVEFTALVNAYMQDGNWRLSMPIDDNAIQECEQLYEDGDVDDDDQFYNYWPDTDFTLGPPGDCFMKCPISGASQADRQASLYCRARAATSGMASKLSGERYDLTNWGCGSSDKNCS